MKADTIDRFYNVGTGTRTSLKELAELLLELTGCEPADPLRAAQPGDVRAQPHRHRRAGGAPRSASPPRSTFARASSG